MKFILELIKCGSLHMKMKKREIRTLTLFQLGRERGGGNLTTPPQEVFFYITQKVPRK